MGGTTMSAPPPAGGATPAPAPPFPLPLSLSDCLSAAVGSGKKMLTGWPRLTTSLAAGIWLEILAFGSALVGEDWPSVRSLVRSFLSASDAVSPTMLGTLTLPLPTAIRIVTADCFL